MLLQKGQKIKLGDIGIQNTFTVECALTSPFVIDVTCFGVNKENKLIDDRYMVFYNVKSSPGNEIKLIQESPSFKFDINTSNLPAHIEKLVFTAAIDGAENMSTLGKLQFKLGSAELTLTGSDFKLEKAIIIAEVYQKDGIWRLGAVGQGFNGGLDALLTYFGGQQADPVEQKSVPSMQSVKPEQQAKKVFLEKRVNLEKTLAQTAPKILDLSKKAAVSLEKRGLGEHKAKVALCLDISGSMTYMYQKGLVQEFAERILALACRLDDDGSIDVFLFGKGGYQPPPLSIGDFPNYTQRMLKTYPLEGDTRYAAAIELVRKFYTPYQYERGEPLTMDIPVYVMFITDGQPSDKGAATRALKNASLEPIFWQFMGIGEDDGYTFEYLKKLDDLKDRYIDNADFFSVANLKQLTDEQLYEKLTNEYPKWVEQAKNKSLIKG